jgi:pimeloyl-ACP methyl ester carboxylesterase
METEKMSGTVESTLVFIHGLDSSSRGAKGAYFQARYPRMIVEDFVGTFEERMAQMEALLADQGDLTLIGSSLGGLMAAVFSCRNGEKIAKLILLAPALNHLPPAFYQDLHLNFPVVIYHGSQDDVVPPVPVHDLAHKIFTNLTYHLVEDDHSLHQTFFTLAWDDLLS